LNKILNNVGGLSINFDAFKKAYDSNTTIKKMIKNFDQRGLTLDTNAEGPDMPTTKGKRTKGIDAMAKRATKKRS
tara:strand:+ start:3583 stop:3807 length:225 start_codon:yes stop_codon:yes gene_type:complete